MICGAGSFSRLALAEIQKEACDCVVAGIEGQADPGLEDGPYPFVWLRAGEINRLVSFFKTHDITQAIMVGKINPLLVYRLESWDPDALKLLRIAGSGSPTELIGLVIGYLAERGIETISPPFLFESYFCREGPLTRNLPSIEAESDIVFGLKAARTMADLDIGQTVVVKGRAVVAVEGMDGTDETVRRAGKLAGTGSVVVKVGRTRQDLRIDIPAVGLDTLKALADSGAAVLAIEADKVVFFQREAALDLAEARGIVVVARRV